MMTQQTGFTILTAPLAALDRRALSQAWYSALHLARQAKSHGTAPAPLATPASAVPERPRAVHAGRGLTVAREAHNTRVQERPPTRALLEAPNVDRRCVRSPLARSIERTFLHPSRRVQRATFSVDGSRERVHVSLQTCGKRVRLVAVCPPALRSVVADALAQARYALAAAGIELTVC